MELTELEKKWLTNISLDLGGPGAWRECYSPASIGAFDTHVIDCIESLGGVHSGAAWSGVRLAVAGLFKLAGEIRSSGYPFDYVLALQIEDSWLIRGETPPELAFVGSSRREDLEVFFNSLVDHCHQLDAAVMAVSFDGERELASSTWLLQSPVANEIEDRYFLRILYNTPFVVQERRHRERPVSAVGSQVVRRLFEVLRESFNAFDLPA